MSDANATAKPPPNGFKFGVSRGAFSNHNGPFYVASAADDLRSGLYVLPAHCNSMSILHGGMASAFADRALALAVWSAAQRMSVTLKLTMEFMAPARVGDWIEAHPEVFLIENDLVHVSADLLRDGQLRIARADAIFRLLRRRQ